MTDIQILTIQTGADYRIFCISDIHGSLGLLEELLGRVKPKDSDILIFLGDYIGKGDDNEGVMDLLMELSQRPNTYFVQGNHDRVNNWLIRYAAADEALDFLSCQPNTLLHELALKEGFGQITPDNLTKVRDVITAKYSEKLDWLMGHPVVVENEAFIFAHAGLEERSDWRNSEVIKVVRNDGFLRDGRNLSGKWLVVGHWPTYNVYDAGPSNNPVIFNDRKIIGIDGGCNTKHFHQLNAFIIESSPGKASFSNVFAAPFPVGAIAKDYHPEQQGSFLKDSWPDFDLELLEEGEFFSLCSVKASGRTGLVKNEHIVSEDSGNYRYKTNTVSYLLSVRQHEKVYILDDSCKGYILVKNMNGIIGWVPWEVIGR